MNPVRKPRILMFLMFPLWGSGSGVYARKLAETLARRGYEVAVACPDKRRVPGVKIYHVPLPFMAAFTSHPEHKDAKKYSELTAKQLNELYLAFHRGFTKAADDFRPDVIHAHHAAHTAWVANLCRAIYRTNYLITVHGTDVYNASLDRRYIIPTLDALNHADFITVVSHQTRKWMLKVFGRSYQRRIRTITGAVDPQTYPATGPVSRVNRRYQLPGKKVVLFTGKLIPTKGVTYLVRAARQIDAEVFIIGDGPERKRLMAQAKGNPRVHFPGYLASDWLPEFYRRADVLVVPSVWDEPLGLISLEAMSSGTPVVASNKGGISEAVKHGHNGYLVRARSARAIAEAVNKLLGNEELLGKTSRNARQFIERKFSWDVIVDQFIPHYQTVAANTAKRHRVKRPPHVQPGEVEREQHDIDVAKKIQGPHHHR
jgi:glycosyltransferase involved in cell wall biosynthesis